MLSDRYAGPWPYFIVAYTWSWLFWIPAALSGRAVGELPLPLLWGPKTLTRGGQ